MLENHDSQFLMESTLIDEEFDVLFVLLPINKTCPVNCLKLRFVKSSEQTQQSTQEQGDALPSAVQFTPHCNVNAAALVNHRAGLFLVKHRKGLFLVKHRKGLVLVNHRAGLVRSTVKSSEQTQQSTQEQGDALPSAVQSTSHCDVNAAALVNHRAGLVLVNHRAGLVLVKHREGLFRSTTMIGSSKCMAELETTFMNVNHHHHHVHAVLVAQ
jgi:hypothetical protein